MNSHHQPPAVVITSPATQQPLPALSGPLQDLNTNLTIRLINDTLILLPVTGCQPVDLLNESRRESLYACLVDWTQVKLVESILNEDEGGGGGVGGPRRHHSFVGGLQRNDLTNNEITYDFLRYSYLSINSLLAVCGILVNLFIILILLFNLRQRHRSTGNNMAAKNNLLLFQLTITGIILGTYMLIDNMNLCTQIDQYARLGSAQLCREPLVALPVPLLTFLPRTYFQWTTKVNEPSSRETSSCPVIILKYMTNTSLSEMDGRHARASFGYWDVGAASGNRTKRFDISSHHLQISAAILNCRQQQSTTDNPSPPPAPHSSTTETNSLKLMLIMGALPLFINIVASAHIWTVAALAHDRYRAIAHPFHYLRSVHSSRTKTFFALSWLILLTLNLVLPISVNDHNLTNELGPSQEHSSMTHWYSWLLDWLTRIHNLDNTVSQGGSLEIETHAAGQYSLTSIQEVHCDSSAAVLARHLTTLLREPTSTDEAKVYSNNNNLNNEMHVIMLIVLSFMGYLAVILLPLIIITICNIGIFRIVKVHERRLSFSSSTTVAASNMTLQQQQQSKQASSMVQVDLHHQMMMRREIADRAAALDKQVPLIKQIIKTEAGSNKRRLRTPQVEPSGFGTEAECRQGLSSNESLLASSRNSGSLDREIHGVLLSAGSERFPKRLDRAGPQASYEDISRYHGASRRVSSSEESYYENNDPNSKESLINHESSASIYRYLRSVSSSPAAHHSYPAPLRKTSDSGLVMTAHEDSADGTQQHMSDSDLESPTLSNSPSCLFRERTSSGSIMNQLKLAGLSFAGIAIQQPSKARAMHKSSSTCSFGGFQSSMNWSYNRQQSCDQSASSRASCDFSYAAVPNTKRSYVSLNGTLKQYDDFTTNKYKTKLLEEPQHFYTPPTQTTSRLTLSFGTKSAIFNILVWLIMTLILLTLPHYLISILKPVTSLRYHGPTLARGRVETSATESLCEIFKLFTRHESHDTSLVDWCYREEEKTHSVDRYLGTLIVDSITVYLACLSRLLFLIIIPLNGCLYGFSSRSFRTTIKMILKRYISKKQASIEINQRHRPLSGLHQRASSCSSVPSILHEFRNYTSPKKELHTSGGLEKFFDTRKLMRILRLKTEDGLKGQLDMPSNPTDNTASQATKNIEHGTFMPPQISLDDSYCQSNTLSETNNLNLLTNSLNSSLSVACSVVDLKDISYFRESSNSSTSGGYPKKHMVSQRHSTGKRARAASVSSFGHQVNAPRDPRGHSTLRANHLRSRSVDYSRNNTYLGAYVVGRINKNRMRKPASRCESRCSVGQTGHTGKNQTPLASLQPRVKENDSLWRRIRYSIAAFVSRDGLHLFNAGKGSESPNEQLPSENQCNVALLSSSPAKGQRSSSALKVNENKWFVGLNRPRNLSKSPTLDSIDSDTSISMGDASCCVIRPPVQQHIKEYSKNCHSSSVQTRDKNNLYLKPPTFLKLSLEVGGHMKHSYRITSTLSPIRESSSNHSYASSQSSLANTTGRTHNWPTTLPDTLNSFTQR